MRAGVFTVTVEQHARENASLRFQWLDRTPPARPRLRARATAPGRARLTWSRAPERGSGVESYSITVNGRTVRSLDADVPYISWETRLSLARGWHRVGVFGTDRAGNRGRAAIVRIRVR